MNDINQIFPISCPSVNPKIKLATAAILCAITAIVTIGAMLVILSQNGHPVGIFDKLATLINPEGAYAILGVGFVAAAALGFAIYKISRANSTQSAASSLDVEKNVATQTPAATESVCYSEEEIEDNCDREQLKKETDILLKKREFHHVDIPFKSEEKKSYYLLFRDPKNEYKEFHFKNEIDRNKQIEWLVENKYIDFNQLSAELKKIEKTLNLSQRCANPGDLWVLDPIPCNGLTLYPIYYTDAERGSSFTYWRNEGERARALTGVFLGYYHRNPAPQYTDNQSYAPQELLSDCTAMLKDVGDIWFFERAEEHGGNVFYYMDKYGVKYDYKLPQATNCQPGKDARKEYENLRSLGRLPIRYGDLYYGWKADEQYAVEKLLLPCEFWVFPAKPDRGRMALEGNIIPVLTCNAKGEKELHYFHDSVTLQKFLSITGYSSCSERASKGYQRLLLQPGDYYNLTLTDQKYSTRGVPNAKNWLIYCDSKYGLQKKVQKDDDIATLQLKRDVKQEADALIAEGQYPIRLIYDLSKLSQRQKEFEGTLQSGKFIAFPKETVKVANKQVDAYRLFIHHAGEKRWVAFTSLEAKEKFIADNGLEEVS